MSGCAQTANGSELIYVQSTRKSTSAKNCRLSGVRPISIGCRKLCVIRHYQGKIDGVFGPRTRGSIRAYQKAENLPAIGQLDPKTARKLAVTSEGHDKTGYEITQGKPSASIQWAKGSRRTSKTHTEVSQDSCRCC